VDVNRARAGEGELEIMVNKGTVAKSVRMMSAAVFKLASCRKNQNLTQSTFQLYAANRLSLKIPVLPVAV